MNSAKELIDWFWVVAKFKPLLKSQRYPMYENGPCQCGTEKLIKHSSDPSRMRAFMMIGVLIDQMIWTHFQDLHSDFAKIFRYPKLIAHGPGGMAPPNWMACTTHGNDKKMDWNVVSEVCDLLLNDLYDWFRDNGLLEEMKKFQQILKTEVIIEFETVNRDKLMPIIERIEQERPYLNAN